MQHTAEQLPQQTHEHFNTELRHRNDTVTWLAESLYGSMRTNFDYQFDGQELYAEDGGAIGEVFDTAITNAKEIVTQNPNLLFELRRRLIESSEYDDMIRMSKHELPNTMVVVSDFPPELTSANQDVGGYSITRQQTMLRVITRHADGTVRVTSQSLDGSNRQALEAIYERLGVTPRAGELLGQRIHQDIPEAWQDTLVDNLSKTYDESMMAQYGGRWHAGIEQHGEELLGNTADFVAQQTDLIDWFVTATLTNSQAAEKLRYGLAATMHARFRAATQHNAQAPSSFNDVRLQTEIDYAIRRAQGNNQSFSGCGITSGVLSEDLAKEQLSEAGYGNRTEESTKYDFNKEMHCVVCQAPPKKEAAKKMCGPCGICRSCDQKLSSKG